MADNRPAYSVCVPNEGRDGKTYWQKIGVGWDNRNGRGINLKLFAMPLASTWDGTLCIFPNDRESSGDRFTPPEDTGGFGGTPGYPSTGSGPDDIPF